MARSAPTVDAWLDTLDTSRRVAIDALRSIVVTADPTLTEEIKWNAPSYSRDGQDRITLGVESRSGYRVVLHRGARVPEAASFCFDDPDKLASWPSPDRGVVRLVDRADIEAKAATLTSLIARWVVAAG